MFPGAEMGEMLHLDFTAQAQALCTQTDPHHGRLTTLSQIITFPHVLGKVVECSLDGMTWTVESNHARIFSPVTCPGLRLLSSFFDYSDVPLWPPEMITGMKTGFFILDNACCLTLPRSCHFQKWLKIIGDKTAEKSGLHIFFEGHGTPKLRLDLYPTLARIISNSLGRISTANES
jgi:hypothetical protein